MRTDVNVELLLARIDELAKERNINRTTAFEQSGVGKNFKSNLSIAKPSVGKITQLANYFGVSVDYLLGKTDDPGKEKKPAAFSDELWNMIQNDPKAITLLEMILKMSKEQREKLEKFMEEM